MNGTKNTLKSLGVMGPIVGVVVMALNAVFGTDTVTADDTAVIVDQGSALIYAGATLWTVVTAVIGRIRARQALSLKAPLRTPPTPTKTGE